MLGKQGWKFLSQPDALVTKVFKARYFPKWDFLSASLGNGPSYVWQSIRKSQEVVRRGSRWRLGNGEKVRVWGEQWLRDDENLEVITVPNIQLEGLRVCDLILPGTLDWDVQKLYNLFEERDCREIVNIPLGMDGLIDRRIWHYDPKGNYTVRSAYRVLMDKVTPHAELRVQGPWSKLWGVRAPPKMKILLWRLAREVLPNRAALLNRHVQVPGQCGVCDSDSETNHHLFLDCDFAKDCWELTEMKTSVMNAASATVSFQDWLFMIFDSVSEPHLARIAAVLWGIWHERNQRVWSHEAGTAWSTVRLALDSLQEWEKAQGPIVQAGGRQPGNVCNKWHAPPAGKVKCNSDIAIHETENAMGMGMVVRNEEGTVLGFRTWHGSGTWTPREGEAAALLCAMKWIIEAGLERVIFEVDAEGVRNALRSTEQDESEFGCLIRNCRRVLNEFPQFEVQVVRRNRNRVAHELAQRSFSSDILVDGISSPDGMANVINDICFVQNH
ncbi:Putative ribonuclease H protein At1g65750 [Linum perenne]